MATSGFRWNTTHIDPNQLTPSVTANEADDAQDAAANAPINIDVSAGGTITLTTAQWASGFRFRLVGAPGGAFTLEVPSGTDTAGVAMFWNSSGQTATIQTENQPSPSTTVSMADGDSAFIYSDGDIVLGGVSGGPGPTGPTGATGASTVSAHDLEHWLEGSPGNSQRIRRWIMSRETTFPGDLVGSQALAATTATSSAAFSIRTGQFGSPDDSVEVATMTFASGADNAVFATTGSPTESFTVSEGEYLEIIAPASADSTLADIALNIRASGVSGAWEELSIKTLSAVGEIAFTSTDFDATAFYEYEISITGLTASNTGTILNMTVSDDDGATYESTSYKWINRRSSSTLALGEANSNSDSDIELVRFIDNGSGDVTSVNIRVSDLSETGVYKTMSWACHQHGTNNVALWDGAGGWAGGTTAIDAFKFLISAGTMTGTITLKGRRK